MYRPLAGARGSVGMFGLLVPVLYLATELLTGLIMSGRLFLVRVREPGLQEARLRRRVISCSMRPLRF